jgi:hypothetical protein
MLSSWSVAEGVGVDRDLESLIERRNRLDLVKFEREVEHVDVLSKPLGVGRLRHGNEPQLRIPAQDDLRTRLSVAISDGGDRRMREKGTAFTDRRPRFRAARDRRGRRLGRAPGSTGSG